MMMSKCKCKLRLVVFCLLFSICAPVVAFADVEKSEWQFSKEIHFQEDSPYRAVFLDEEVYAHAREDLGDLRVVDSSGNLVPYFLESGYIKTEEENTTYSSEIVHVQQKDNDTLIDFYIQPLHENTDIQGNILTLVLPNQEFLKHVEIFGSFDGNSWDFLMEDKLYNTDQVRKDTIHLNEVYKYNYYRLRVINNVERVEFSSLQLIHSRQAVQSNMYIKQKILDYEVTTEDRQTIVKITNAERLKVGTIIFSIADKNFQRNFTVQGVEGQFIATSGGNELYHLSFEDIELDNTEIQFSDPKTSEQITVVINNEDNQPLKIENIDVEFFIDQLVFEDNGSSSYTLLYGNKEATRPVYDIANFKSHILRENPSFAELENAVEQSEYEAETNEPAWYQTRELFNIVVMVVSLLLIVVIVQKLSSNKKKQT